MEYKDYNDFELLDYISENNEDANNIMFKKYQPLISSIAKKMLGYTKGTGLELNDLIQEGMLGLSNAIDKFTYSKETSFYTYAKTCIERKMISQVIMARRQKRKILNEAISLDGIDEYGKEINFDFFLKDESINPEKILVNTETEEEFIDLSNEILTDFEKEVIELKMNGFEYKEIANILEKDSKSIDNALQRARNKLKEATKKEDY